MKQKRRLEHINHWIAELRSLAIKKRPRLRIQNVDDSYSIMTKTDLRGLFCRNGFEEAFREGKTPAEALSDELECWTD